MNNKITNLGSEIIGCFANKIPQTIIVGGSYSTNEACTFRYRGNDLWLSDFDLLCIHKEGYSETEKDLIYKKMLILARRIPQWNPYFHIGLKMRNPLQLRKEIDSLYFKELSVNSYNLVGNEFSSFFGPNEIIGFDRLSKTELNSKLYAWGLTRLWCNVLFFPIKYFDTKNHSYYKFWYNYFFCRGAMDWITFELIQKQLWQSSYSYRFDVWNNLKTNSINVQEAFRICLDIKVGNIMVDIKPIIRIINDFAYNKLKDFKESLLLLDEDSEFEFLKNMMLVIEFEMNFERYDKNRVLTEAKRNLETITKSKFAFVSEGFWGRWSELREVYSEFRFLRNPIDKFDHSVYTRYFLEIGKK